MIVGVRELISVQLQLAFRTMRCKIELNQVLSTPFEAYLNVKGPSHSSRSFAKGNRGMPHEFYFTFLFLYINVFTEHYLTLLIF